MDPHRDFAPGELLEGTVYRVVRCLGEGRTGAVYEVEDVTVGRRYVLKTLASPDPTADPARRSDLAERLRDEARALSGLSHPNIVELITAGVTTCARRSPFFVMPLLVGRSVRDILEVRGALPLGTALGIAVDLLDALAHAHRAGIVHRDVRPENVFVHRNVDGTYVTKLLDFGLSRLRDEVSPESVRRGWAPSRYASPEQVRGAGAHPGDDVFAAGVMLFEMIAGTPPPASVSPSTIASDPRFPPALVALLASSFANDPAARPSSAQAFGDALRAHLKTHRAPARKVVTARLAAAGLRPTPSEAIRRSQLAGGDTEVDTGAAPTPRRAPRFGGIAAAAALLITLGVVVQTWRGRPSPPTSDAEAIATEVSHDALGAPLEPPRPASAAPVPGDPMAGRPVGLDAGPDALAPLRLPEAGAALPPHGPVRAPKHRPRR